MLSQAIKNNEPTSTKIKRRHQEEESDTANFNETLCPDKVSCLADVQSKIKKRCIRAVNQNKACLSKSCASIKDIVSNAESGYYWIELWQEKKEVFCDMINFGGGWTLVASISSSNNNHLLRTEVNCLLPNRCVENVSSDIPTRKMSDKDIHAIATTEGTFRVDQVSNGFTAFFKIPIGAHLFNSECFGASCPRIIVSHSYPYQWESNCKGTELGYQITDTPNRCYRVFDMYDNGECGHSWSSSKYGTNRVLYGFPCSSFSGIYGNKQGLLFVK
ncbi:uncharacterized protein [Pocillopora verrucosa]|uniref:uncharacterized protein n=1 Tax=Pocillopora verrucosa TaxID=203993 RepID=UPI0033401340